MLKASLEHLRMFRALAEHGTYQQAADAVFKTPSAVHHAIAKLEDAFGCALFEIQGRQSLLTPAGQVLLRRARFLLNEADKLQQVAAALSVGTETRLRLAIDQAFPPAQLYPIVDEISQTYPTIRLEFHETVLGGAVEMLQHDEADIAIGPVTLDGALNEEVCAVNFLAVASPRHPLSQPDSLLSMQDLVSHRQIVLRDSATKDKSDAGWLGSEQRWTVSHIRTSVELVVSGFGFAWLPQHAIQSQLDQGVLQQLELGHASTRQVGFYLNFRDTDALGPAAQDFLAAIRKQR